MEITGSTFTLHPITGTDTELSDVLEVYRQCEDFLALGPVAQASTEMVLADLALSVKEGGTYYGIYDKQTGMMMGIVDFVTCGFEGRPDVAYLSLLMIAAPYRSQGLGAEVVRVVEEEIRRMGQARAIQSGVQINNPGGIRFWQRMGYRIVSGPIDHEDGTTAYDLWKDV